MNITKEIWKKFNIKIKKGTVFTVTSLADKIDVSRPTATNILKRLAKDKRIEQLLMVGKKAKYYRVIK